MSWGRKGTDDTVLMACPFSINRSGQNGFPDQMQRMPAVRCVLWRFELGLKRRRVPQRRPPLMARHLLSFCLLVQATADARRSVP